jgi:Flp pilus assembly protein TadG
MIFPMKHFARRSLRHFLADTHGLGAVEFALIFPLMLVLYFGAFEITQMLTADRRTTSVAYTAADLVAQAASISNGEMNDVFAASSAIMKPFSTDGLSIRITSVVANAAGVNKVAWSDGHKIAPRSVGSNFDLPAGLTTPGTSVIVAEVFYTYTSPISSAVTKSINFKEVSYLKPRRANSIPRTN